MASAEKLLPFDVVLTGKDGEQRLTVLAATRQAALRAFSDARAFMEARISKEGRCRIAIESMHEAGRSPRPPAPAR